MRLTLPAAGPGCPSVTSPGPAESPGSSQAGAGPVRTARDPISRLRIAALVLSFMLAPLAAAAPPYPTNVCAADRVADLNCTANDVEVARVQVLNNVVTCRSGEVVDLDLRAFLHLNSQDRHDVGIFMAKDGRSPVIPSAGGGSADCSVFDLPKSPSP